MKKMIFSALVMLLSMFAFQTNAQVKIGDIMEKSGTKGIVVYVDETRQHGLLMSVKHVTKKQRQWCEKEYAKEVHKASDENDGMKNTQAVIDFAKSKGVALSKSFPLFDWAVNTCGEGWYIPSINELLTMAKSLNNGQLEDFNIKTDQFKAFEKKLKKAKGDEFAFDNTIPPMLSSTEGKRNALGMGSCNILYLEVTYDNVGKAVGRGIAAGLVGASSNTGKGNFKTEFRDKHYPMSMSVSMFSRAFHKF